MIVGLDFDSTITTNSYPKVGTDLGAVPWLIEAQARGAQFVLFTMRDGQELADAAKYLIDRGVRLLGVNTNPTQWQWTNSPKAYCHFYIDDRNLGIPKNGPDVDWSRVGPLLLDAVAHYRPEKDLLDAKRYVGGQA